jgi:hypothetical protein
MKALNLLLAAMFILFAFVQINDPDPVLWILIYGLMAVACILAAFGYYYPKALTVLLLLYLVYSFFPLPGVFEWLRSEDKSLLFDDIAKMQYPYIELAREFLGLIICILVLTMHLLTWRSGNRRTAH